MVLPVAIVCSVTMVRVGICEGVGRDIAVGRVVV